MSKRMLIAGFVVTALAVFAAGAAYAWHQRLPTLWEIPDAPSRATDVSSRWHEASPIDAVRVLYVGHSLIGEDIPVMSARIAESLGARFDYDAQWVDGGSLEVNWNRSPRK